MQAHLGRVRLVLLAILGLQLAVWSASKEFYPRWEAVPPVPSRNGAVLMALGDPEFAYRFLALTLQDLGDVGIDITPLKNYNYTELGKWFSLLNSLDSLSDHVPMVAAYYFGGTKVPKDAAVVANYLSAVGQVPIGEKWRWLAHAAFLAQHRTYNLDLALKWAYTLQRMYQSGVDMPQWARQMPAFVLSERGDKDAARQMMKNMLVTEKTMDPAEINFMASYLTDELGVAPEEVKSLLRLRGGASSP
ncbi:MAG: hypothetical protein HY052_03930 [Proteobacteria bacterium]|nr:hypothetical protein [Pseudomonadota bacterium]